MLLGAAEVSASICTTASWTYLIREGILEEFEELLAGILVVSLPP